MFFILTCKAIHGLTLPLSDDIVFHSSPCPLYCTHFMHQLNWWEGNNLLEKPSTDLHCYCDHGARLLLFLSLPQIEELTVAAAPSLSSCFWVQPSGASPPTTCLCLLPWDFPSTSQTPTWWPNHSHATQECW